VQRGIAYNDPSCCELSRNNSSDGVNLLVIKRLCLMSQELLVALTFGGIRPTLVVLVIRVVPGMCCGIRLCRAGAAVPMKKQRLSFPLSYRKVSWRRTVSSKTMECQDEARSCFYRRQ
jgi:hypothetical protein